MWLGLSHWKHRIMVRQEEEARGGGEGFRCLMGGRGGFGWVLTGLNRVRLKRLGGSSLISLSRYRRWTWFWSWSRFAPSSRIMACFRRSLIVLVVFRWFT